MCVRGKGIGSRQTMERGWVPMVGVKIRRDCRRRDEIVLVTPPRAFTSGPCSFFLLLLFFFWPKNTRSRCCLPIEELSTHLRLPPRSFKLSLPSFVLGTISFRIRQKTIATISIFYDKNYYRLFTVFTKQSFFFAPDYFFWLCPNCVNFHL